MLQRDCQKFYNRKTAEKSVNEQVRAKQDFDEIGKMRRPEGT